MYKTISIWQTKLDITDSFINTVALIICPHPAYKGYSVYFRTNIHSSWWMNKIKSISSIWIMISNWSLSKNCYMQELETHLYVHNIHQVYVPPCASRSCWCRKIICIVRSLLEKYSDNVLVNQYHLDMISQWRNDEE